MRKTKSKRKYKYPSLGLLFLIIPIGYVLYRYYSNDWRLKNYGELTKAVIINEDSYMKNAHLYNSEDRMKKYRFSIGGQEFKGNSQSSNYEIGDTLLIRYLPSNPAINSSERFFK